MYECAHTHDGTEKLKEVHQQQFIGADICAWEASDNNSVKHTSEVEVIRQILIFMLVSNYHKLLNLEEKKTTKKNWCWG